MQLQIHPPLDLLAAEDGRSLLNEPLIKRRSLLEKFATAHFDRGRIRLSPATLKLAQAKTWLAKTGTMLDGIVAKRRHVAYRSGERDGMQKIKNFRTADCVVGGFLCRRRESGRFASARLVRLARVTSSRWLHFKPWPSPIDLD